MPKISSIGNNANKTIASSAFKRMIDQHLAMLLKSTTTRTVTIEPNEAAKYTGDLQGLLISKGVSEIMMYPVMRLNGYSSFAQFAGDRYSLLMPEPNIINNLLDKSQTTSI